MEYNTYSVEFLSWRTIHWNWYGYLAFDKCKYRWGGFISTHAFKNYNAECWGLYSFNRQPCDFIWVVRYSEVYSCIFCHYGINDRLKKLFHYQFLFYRRNKQQKFI